MLYNSWSFLQYFLHYVFTVVDHQFVNEVILLWYDR